MVKPISNNRGSEGAHLDFRESIRGWFLKKDRTMRSVFFMRAGIAHPAWYHTSDHNRDTMRHIHIRLFIVLLTALALAHLAALQFFLYWRHEWLDMPMHVLGGVVVALGVFAIKDLGLPAGDRVRRFIPVMVTVLAMSLTWEVYEFTIGMVLVEQNFLWDTSTDLTADLLGGLAGYWIGRKLITNRS